MNQNYDFYADAVATQEVTIHLMLASVLKFHPEIAKDFTANLQALLANQKMHNASVKSNLQNLLAFANKYLPTPVNGQ